METISEYAQERLEESGEAEEIRRLHAEFYLALAEEAEPRVRGPEALNRKQGNVLEVATVLNSMAYAELARGNKERARALLEESLPLNRELGNKLGVAHCLMALGIA